MKSSMQVVYILAALFVIMVMAIVSGRLPYEYTESIKAAMSLALGTIAGILAKLPQE